MASSKRGPPPLIRRSVPGTVTGLPLSADLFIALVFAIVLPAIVGLADPPHLPGRADLCRQRLRDVLIQKTGEQDPEATGPDGPAVVVAGAGGPVGYERSKVLSAQAIG